MNIFLTLDYELYFGRVHGTVENCMLKPTRELMKIAREGNAPMTFFVDIGFIRKLDEARKGNSALERDYQQICEQITALVREGHDCQLHIHPHWEDSHFTDGKWQIDVSRYKLADFAPAEAAEIVRSYHASLVTLTGKPVDSYRAGGWCLQPFEPLADVFAEKGILTDSTVFRGGFNNKPPYYYDFRGCPDKTRWHFHDNLCKEVPDGRFLELPITEQKSSPLFFWQLYGWGRLNPKQHKPIGDGFPVPGGGSKWDFLTKPTQHPVSMDGYFVNGLNRAVKKLERQEKEDLVVIGHPKACTWYSLSKLQRFVNKHKSNHRFKTISEA